MGDMAYHSIPIPPPDSVWDDAPSYVRSAMVRKARAWRVLRLYKRRGWNPTAVVTEYSRACDEVHIALDRWEHDELNPSLF